VQLDAYPKRLDDQLLDFVLQQPLAVPSAGVRARRDDSANPRLHLEPPLVNEVLNDLMCGVGVDLQLRRQCADRRKGLTWLKLATDERLRRGKYHLVEDGLSRLKGESEECHSHNVTDVTDWCQTVRKTPGDGRTSNHSEERYRALFRDA